MKYKTGDLILINKISGNGQPRFSAAGETLFRKKYQTNNDIFKYSNTHCIIIECIPEKDFFGKIPKDWKDKNWNGYWIYSVPFQEFELIYENEIEKVE